jgi:hypothetical protein
MRGDHPPRSVCSFRSLFSRHSLASRQPGSSPPNGGALVPPTSEYEPHRPVTPPQIQITELAPAHATGPPPSPHVFISQPISADVPSSESSPAPSPSHRLLQGVAAVTRLSLKVCSFDPSVTTMRHLTYVGISHQHPGGTASLVCRLLSMRRSIIPLLLSQ